MNSNYGWRFPILDGGKKQGINDSGIATFAGSELYNNLAREICQNSLDAKDEEIKDPVVVSFNLKTIYKPAFSPVAGLEETLKRCETYWEDYDDKKLESFLSEAFESIGHETIDILVASDFNTKGLCGSRTKSGSWDALTGSNGVSYKIGGSQGSFGIGKNAPYACSSLRTVFYNTYSKEDGEKAFQGVTSLVTHLDSNGNETQGCGFYYDSVNRKPIFDVKDNAELSIFAREEFGTDIIILGFKKNPNWKSDIKEAVIKNFFLSILNSKLVVRIDKEEINKDTILNLLNELILLNDDEDLKRIKKYCDTYLSPTQVFEASILSNKDVTLYLKVKDDYDRSISYFRSSGMLIYEKKIKKMKPYEAVLVVHSGKFNDLLKLTEPPKHDKWDYKLLDDKDREDGRKALQKLNKFVLESIETLCKLDDCDEIDPDGLSDFLPDDISDIGAKKKNISQHFDDNTVEIGGIKKTDNIISNEIVEASKNLGSETDGDVHNDTDGGESDDISKPGESLTGDGDIVSEDEEGPKTIPTELKSSIRVLPVDVENGLYRLICKFKANYSKAIIRFNAMGEDGGKDELLILEYKNGDDFTPLNKSYFEIINIESGTNYDLMLRFNLRSRTVVSVGGVGYETK